MTPHDQTRPTALVVGPMKCGTSWIHDYFEDRGDICLPNGIKETFYYDRHPRRGLDWYTKHFTHFNANQHRAIVEVAPSLFHVSSTAAPHILSELGDIPIVITLRDPVKRAWSHYQHMSRGYTALALQDAVQEFPEILDASRYSAHMPIWKKHFSNVTALQQAHLAEDPEEYVATLSAHLNLPAIHAGQRASQRSNQATSPRSYLLARVGRYGARAFRYVGLYSIVNAFKNAGLKNLFYGGGQSETQTPSDDDLSFLMSALEDETVYFASLRDLS
ncbi:sulfotransferase domain-containing protein [Loktanella sp. F6476L]|uniref:sulfotransferase domain-containing protein n=1 Tax=Loktanella sp. F6476L TaxID=2926405 RepID=UPI001FF6E316|nr:sulfotransferase domain-containing protein [Loktanella sp. F6476L]MCK0122419.1 sulfotransferase domain-containing protein [Loktanella sp. F6476L]